MRHKIVSLVLIVVMTFSFMGTVHSEYYSSAEKIVNKLLELSSGDRKNAFILMKTYIATDSGVDAIVSLINNHNPLSNSILDKGIGSVLQYTDKETAAKSIQSLKIIEEDVRRKYVDAFDKRETLKLSSSALDDLQYFLTKSFSKVSGLEKLMNDDGITTEVIANMLKAIVDVNNGIPLLTDEYSGSDDFGIHMISRSFRNRADKYLAENSMDSISTLINKYFNNLNSNLNAEEKARIKRIGKEIGFYTSFKELIPRELSSGIGYQKSESKITYKVIDNISVFSELSFNGLTNIEFEAYIDNVKQDGITLDKPHTIRIPVLSDNIMVYKLEESLENPIKYSAYSNGYLYIRIDSTGYYGIKDMPKHFEDADGWGSKYVESLYNRGIINGKSDKIFAPDDNITREEFVKLIVELFDFSDDKLYMNFSDVNQNDWYYSYVANAYKHNIISGIGDNRFGVGYNIIRQDICKIISNVIKIKNIDIEVQKEGFVFVDNNTIDDYAKESVELMYKLGIISGDDNGYFSPKNNATRQEAAKIIHGLLEMYVKSTL